MKLAKGWQRQNIQFMLGERRVGLDNVPIARTVIRLNPTGYQIERAVDVLGDDEWNIRTGTSSEEALGFAGRLRSQPEPASGASWHILNVTSDEFATARAALLELADGTRSVPDGMSPDEITDLFQELERQLGR
ncbi:hypothetical protein [Micromonospora sp. NPDC003776]